MLQRFFFAVTNIIDSIYGPHSPQLDLIDKARKQAYDRTEAEFYKDRLFVQFMQGYLRELKSAISEGRIVNIQSEAQGEVLGDFLILARKALDEEEKDVAAVLACAALEDALKRCASDRGLNVQDKNMQTVVNALKSRGALEDALKRCASDRGRRFLNVQDKNMQTVVNALKSRGVISSPQGKILDGYVPIRNNTFHAQWEEIDAAAINSIIGFTEVFLVQQFSSPIAADSQATP